MATVVQGKDMKGPPNQTLEDVAEEVLNGMFCHYEPPKEQKKKRRGILRTPRMFRRPKQEQEQQQDRNVRWSDKVEKSYPKPPTTDPIQCNVASACVEACSEAGIVASPTKKARASEIASRLDYDKLKKTKRQVSIAKSTSDETGSKSSSGSSKSSKSSKRSEKSDIPPPPPPPPPAAPSNTFCGAIEITCGEDGEAPEILTLESTNKPYHRPTQKYEYFYDEDNSLVDDDNDSEEDDTSNKRKKKSRRMKYGRKSSKTKALFEGSDTSNSDWEESLHKLSKKGKDGDSFDPISSVRSDEDMDENLNPKKPISKKQSSDWDNSVPIVKNDTKVKNVVPTGRSKKKERRSLSPSRRSRNRSRSPKSRLSLDSAKDSKTKSKTWSTFHPAHPLSKGTTNATNSDISVERQSFITAHRQGFGDNLSNIGQPPPPPPKDSDAALDDMLERQSFITANRQGVDVASLPPRMINHANNIDDRLSYITAHRREMESPRRRMQQKRRGRSPARKGRQGGGRSSSPGLPRSGSPGRRGRSMSPRQRGRSSSPRGRSLSPGTRPWSYYDYSNMQPGMMMPNGIYAPPHPMYSMPPQDPRFTAQSPPLMGPYPTPAIPSNGIQNQSLPVPPQQQGLPHFYPADQSVISSINEAPIEQENQDGKAELSWEERTRQAWERLRNGVVESLSSECSKSGDVSEQSDVESQMQQAGSAATQAGSTLQSPSVQRDQPQVPHQLYQQQPGMPMHPVGILRNTTPERRVTFGPSSEQVYQDDQDENYYVDEAESKKAFKKKMRFRGRKLLSGLFGRNKRNQKHLDEELEKEIDLTQSRSVDVTASNSLSTEEWDESLSQADPAVLQQPYMQYGMSYYHPQQFYPQPPFVMGNYNGATQSQQMPLQQAPRLPMTADPQLFYGYPPIRQDSNSPAPSLPSGYYMPQQQQASQGVFYNQ